VTGEQARGRALEKPRTITGEREGGWPERISPMRAARTRERGAGGETVRSTLDSAGGPG